MNLIRVEQARDLANSMVQAMEINVLRVAVLERAFSELKDYIREVQRRLEPYLRHAKIDFTIDDRQIDIKGPAGFVRTMVTEREETKVPIIQVERSVGERNDVYSFMVNEQVFDLDDPEVCLEHVVRTGTFRRDGNLISLMDGLIRQVFCD